MFPNEKINDLADWLNHSIPSEKEAYSLNDNWHPQKFDMDSKIDFHFIPKQIENLTFKETIIKKIKEYASNLWEKVLNFFKNFKNPMKYFQNSEEEESKLPDNSPQQVICCLCGETHDTDEDPLRLVKTDKDSDLFGKGQRHYLFQYFLLKNLGVIPQMPQGDTYVHYHCAKKADPSGICPFTGTIISVTTDFKIGTIPIAKKARETFFPPSQEEQIQVFRSIVDGLKDFGFVYQGNICLLEEKPKDVYIKKDSETADIQREFSGISSHFFVFPLANDILTRTDETPTSNSSKPPEKFSESSEPSGEGSTIHGIYIEPKASIYEIEFCFLRYLLNQSFKNLLPESKDKTIDKKILTTWIEAELIRRVSNNQVYHSYYIERSLAHDPKSLEYGKSIIQARKSYPVASILSDPRFLPSKEFSEKFREHPAVVIGFLKFEKESWAEETPEDELQAEHKLDTKIIDSENEGFIQEDSIDKKNENDKDKEFKNAQPDNDSNPNNQEILKDQKEEKEG